METLHFPICGEKVVLRPFGVADINEAYLGWLNDPEVTRFSNQRFRRHDRQSAETFLKSFEGGPNHFILIEQRSDGRPIGTITTYLAPRHGTADVGIMVGERSVWGGGFGREAWSLTLEALLKAGIRKVTAGTLACNRGMIKLAERSGMHLEGRRREQELVDGEPVDILHFARFAE